jgi:glucosamine--fructose-6-phosphate aminotransferase (isomerizing)
MNKDHFMLKEILETPIVLDGLATSDFVLPPTVLNKLVNAERILILGCGTSYHAGLLGKIFLERFGHVSVMTIIASEWNSLPDENGKFDLAILISQSGETAEILSAFKILRAKNIFTIAITNAEKSSVAQEADFSIYQNAGLEKSVAATKTFISQAAILLRLALTVKKSETATRELKKLSNLTRQIIKQELRIKAIAMKYKRFDRLFVFGRGTNLPIALEGALKLKESAQVFTEGLPTGELRHGPMAMIDKKLPSIFILPIDSDYRKNLSILADVKKNGGSIIVITTEGNKDLAKLVKDVIYIPKTVEYFYPFLSAVALQLLAYWSGVLRGCNVDKPRNLTKAVTKE